MQEEEMPFPFLLDEAKKRPRNIDGTVGGRKAPQEMPAPPEKEQEEIGSPGFVAKPKQGRSPPEPANKATSRAPGLSIDREKVAPLLEKVKLANQLVREAGVDPSTTGGGIIVASIVEQLKAVPQKRGPQPRQTDVPALTAMAEELRAKAKTSDEPKAAHIDKFSGR